MGVHAEKNIRAVSTPEDTTSPAECQVIFDRTTKTIPLTQGKVAIVDAEDYNFLNLWKWRAQKGGRTYYAVRQFRIPNSNIRIYVSMHREIMKAPEGIIVDHINCDALDNRKSNMRLCIHSENLRSQRPHINKEVKYKGVSVHNNGKNPYAASIYVDGRQVYLGLYPTPEKAATIYDLAALKYFGEFALTNEMLGLLPKRVKPKAAIPQRESMTG